MEWLNSDWHPIFFTLGVALLSTALITPPGIALAWLLARRQWRGKSLVETLVTLPLVAPPVATGLLLLKLFGRHSPLGRFLEGLGLSVVFTWRGVVLALAVMSLPLLVRTARAAFEELHTAVEESARTLGATEWQVFLRVTLPLASRGVIAGCVLAFARALGEFGATIVLAGNIPGKTTTLALGIYGDIQLGHDAAALQLLTVSLVLAFGSIFVSEQLLRRR